MKHFKFTNDFMNNQKIEKEPFSLEILTWIYLNIQRLYVFNHFLDIYIYIYSCQTTLYHKSLFQPEFKTTTTLIDNIFINNFEQKCLSGNVYLSPTTVRNHWKCERYNCQKKLTNNDLPWFQTFQWRSFQGWHKKSILESSNWK